MQSLNIIPSKISLLINKKQQAFANLLAVLDEKQFNLLQKYLTIEEKLNKEQTKELIIRIVNK